MVAKDILRDYKLLVAKLKVLTEYADALVRFHLDRIASQLTIYCSMTGTSDGRIKETSARPLFFFSTRYVPVVFPFLIARN